ncbi:MAG: SDR family oxidoreductase [Rhizobiales bacterium]|nr:SDR family oxidoreductase [Hyphomicrobiales bacterium]
MVFLVTGAARRIGREISIVLAKAGHDLAIHCNRSKTDGEALAKEIELLGRRCVIVQGNLADAAMPARLVDEAKSALGPLTGLINNASVFDDDRIENMTPESWAWQIDINLKAPVLLAQAFAKQLPANASGNIINLVDQRVWKLAPDYFSYTIAKSGLWTATRTLAQALAPRIRVNAIGPGPALPHKGMSKEAFEKLSKSTLLARGTSPQEIAATVLFIISQPAMTGQMIALDGGQHLLWQTPDMTGVEHGQQSETDPSRGRCRPEAPPCLRARSGAQGAAWYP